MSRGRGKGSEAKAAFPLPRGPQPHSGQHYNEKCLRHFLHLMLLKQKDTLFSYSRDIQNNCLKQSIYLRNTAQYNRSPLGLRTAKKR
ncbi:hypothetical protein HMPREF1863_00959 [Aedoeadaptatus coxii]|uniref:Uncharacterized protein n=1 Tax=Aedoeadaptatus coxii TaxID=755172 RepID=A0A134AG67_9FIRM|nr:hypothetical protein HMPREF1863_00959 [Peptoniphilus coxii]